jgi:predicted nucleotidyltransferase
MRTVMLRSRDLTVLRNIVRRYTAVRQARIFGSRAAGAARRASDVDLAISAPDMSVAEWHDLCEALENAPIIYELDIVREEEVSNERLREAIRQDGVVIYQSNDADLRG